MNKQSLVTIITVTYNAEKHLEQTIKSVIEQDYPNIEYIIIDGGSSDGTLDIIKHYKDHINYYISEPDRGIYDAMNKGIEQSAGNWINFLNAGDTYCKKTTIKEISSYITEDIDLISGDIYYVNNNKKKYLKARGLTSVFNGMFCYHQTLFTKSKLLKKYNFNLTFNIAGDYDFVLKCYINNYHFKFLDFAVANYLGGGISERNRILARIEEIFIQSRYLEQTGDVFDYESFHKLSSYVPDNNQKFAYLINNFYNSLDKNKLEEKEFILYGYGYIGELIYKKYKKNIIAIVDKNNKELRKKHNLTINNINYLNKINFNYILITPLGREKEIESHLTNELNIPSKKILKLEI